MPAEGSLERLYIPLMDAHMHSPQFVRPTLADSILVTSDAAVWTLGAFSSDLIAKDSINDIFDIHYIDVVMNANASYEIQLFWGDSDTYLCGVSCTRVNPQSSSVQLAVRSGQTSHLPLPAGSRVRAKCADSAGGSSVNIKLHGHTY